MICNLDGFVLKDEYRDGIQYRHEAGHLDVFMALFMVCTIEIVVLKIMIFDEAAPEEEGNEGSTASNIFPISQSELSWFSKYVCFDVI